MTQLVKNVIRNYIEDFDKAHDYKKLTDEQKKDRMHTIKSTITFCNDLEKASLFSKMKVVYPMSIPNQNFRSIPINFKIN
jgi:hypothetical protein